jgi:hypothetical protein
MRKPHTFIVPIGLIVMTGFIGLAAAGGQSEAPEAPAAPAGMLARCDAPLNDFDAGSAVAGEKIAFRDTRCADPEPVRTQSAGGEIDPNSYTRAHYTVAVYGTCKATGDSGCAPPVQIQTWPACERSPADYTIAGKPLTPTEVLEIRGVPARFYGSDRLELSTGDVTVVIFGTSRDLVLGAASTLRTRPGSPTSVASDQKLPPPVAGAEEGTLSCG